MLVSVVSAGIFVGGSLAITFAAYFAMRWLFGRDAHKDKELAASVLTRIAALHALILALVFAQEMVDYQQLRTESVIEADAVADLYNDARRFGGPGGADIAAAARLYTDKVITRDWPSLATQGRLSGDAWASWEVAYEAVLNLKATDERQTSLREHMLDAIHRISEQRTKREMVGQDEASTMFWFAAISGLLFSAAAYYPYNPERRSILLLGMFGAFTGIILFLIYAFSDPYNAPGFVGPGPFERLKASIVSGSG